MIMIKKTYTLFVISSILLFFSCEKNKIKKQAKLLYTQEISFPATMLCLEGEKYKFLDLCESHPRIVIWYDSTECSICRINDLHKYKSFEQYCQNLAFGPDVIFLFSPTRETVSQLCEEAPSNTKLHDYPIYIDTANMFAKLNPCIPENKLMHSFLLDATSLVSLVGNPIQNQAMFDLYKMTIDEMLN